MNSNALAKIVVIIFGTLGKIYMILSYGMVPVHHLLTGCASNISRYVQLSEIKVFGYKIHDAHFILQYLQQFAVIKTLKPEVAIPLIRLGSFFRGICGKVINLEDVPKIADYEERRRRKAEENKSYLDQIGLKKKAYELFAKTKNKKKILEEEWATCDSKPLNFR